MNGSCIIRGALSALGSAALAACTVGPVYQRPTAPSVKGYTAAPLSSTIAAATNASGTIASSQQLKSGLAVEPRWWRGFGSPTLDRLVEQALVRNPTITEAAATLKQTEELRKAARGAFFPEIAAGLGAGRTRTSGAETGGTFGPENYNLYTGQVGVSYDLDVFGLNRLIVRARGAQVDIARDQLAAARLAIAGNVVNTAIDLAALDDEVVATRENVRDEERVLELTETQFRLGAIDEFAVFTQQSLLASTHATLAALLQERDAAHHLLATLVGRFPADTATLAVPSLAKLRLPTALPLSLPSRLVRQRPDIRAAEASLRAANAQVGEAVARMYPDIELSADFGSAANLASSFFDPASRIWDVAASLAAPLFEGGTLRARKNAAEAAYRAVFAGYQNTVLGAFRNVADVLRALEHDTTLLDAEARSRNAARSALDLVMAEFQAGEVDFLQVMTNEIQFQNARIATIKAEAQRYADTAALYVALGGGQWGSQWPTGDDGQAPRPTAPITRTASPRAANH